MPACFDPQALTQAQKTILRLVQGDLPPGPRPFAALARAAGTDEASVIRFLQTLKENGVIRRFGASVRHQRLGYACNVMVVWRVPAGQADEAGQLASTHPAVSHCYYRPSCLPDWPYTLYTMIHGHSAEACAQTIAELQALTPLLDDHAALATVQELKKISPVYFAASEET